MTVRGLAQRVRVAQFSRPTLILLAAIWLVGFGNLPFWRALWRSEDGLQAGNVLFLLTLPLAALAWTHVTLLALAWGRATKVVLAIVLLASAAASYFTCAYGVLVDASMVANVIQTHVAEARDLAGWSMGVWLAAFGGVPVVLVARARATADPFLRELGRKSIHALAAVFCLTAILVLNYQHYASMLRNHRELRLMLVPHNIVAAVHGYVKQRLATPRTLQPMGVDARRLTATASPAKPLLAVLVVGETARADNFSLNGYARPTNPELARQNVLSFTNVAACGTSTAVSLPCMFSGVGRDHYTDGIALRREGLLDVLQHAGIKVLWRDNNSGCKGVCARVPHEDLSRANSAEWCRDGECYDDILLQGLQGYIDGLQDDAVIVLHMVGSHGPAYFRRYPSEAAAFAPACQTTELGRCSRESIVNAYDNSIRYTDHVLSELIALLERNARRFDTAMLYVSDHGESLGENGLYLHGVPYALAPREQIHVPMIAWLSDGTYDRLSLDRACLAARHADALSHDNFFHSVLGLAMVETSIYDSARDLFHACRRS